MISVRSAEQEIMAEVGKSADKALESWWQRRNAKDKNLSLTKPVQLSKTEILCPYCQTLLEAKWDYSTFEMIVRCRRCNYTVAIPGSMLLGPDDIISNITTVILSADPLKCNDHRLKFNDMPADTSALRARDQWLREQAIPGQWAKQEGEILHWALALLEDSRCPCNMVAETFAISPVYAQCSRAKVSVVSGGFRVRHDWTEAMYCTYQLDIPMHIPADPEALADLVVESVRSWWQQTERVKANRVTITETAGSYVANTAYTYGNISPLSPVATQSTGNNPSYTQQYTTVLCPPSPDRKWQKSYCYGCLMWDAYRCACGHPMQNQATASPVSGNLP